MTALISTNHKVIESILIKDIIFQEVIDKFPDISNMVTWPKLEDALHGIYKSAYQTALKKVRYELVIVWL